MTCPLSLLRTGQGPSPRAVPIRATEKVLHGVPKIPMRNVPTRASSRRREKIRSSRRFWRRGSLMTSTSVQSIPSRLRKAASPSVRSFFPEKA